MNRTHAPGRGKLMARAALGMALAMGTVAGSVVVSEPAHAQKRAKQNFSKGFVAAALPAQEAVNAVTAGDEATIGAARQAVDTAFAAIENADDRLMAGSLAVNLGGKANDPVMQRRGVKAMLESGKLDSEALPRIAAAAGQLAYQAGDHGEAQTYLRQAVDAGYSDPNVVALLGESYIANGQIDQGLALFEKAISDGRASGTLAPDGWYRRGLLAAYQAKNLDKAAQFGGYLIRDYPEPTNVGIAATIVRELGVFGAQETLDVMRLMGRTNSYAEQRDYVEYIQAADPRRLPGETLKVIEAGLAAGKLSASDAFVADARAQANSRLAADRASLDSYAADARKPSATEATISGAADALLSYGRAAEAEALYKIAMTKPGVDTDRTLTRLGIAQIDQQKMAEAQETLGKVTGKRSSIAGLWAAYAARQPAAAQ